MVLYEDLRVYTLWRAEWEHFQKQQLVFHKLNAEWEMLGDLAQRLCHMVPPLI
jgi:Chs5-Arf1p-binding protein BUD7/BCH1